MATGTTSRPGGRSARIRDQVLTAVGDLLVAGGFDAVTVESVAERSGVHRSTVYRRWRSAAMLVADLVALGANIGWAPPDTGSLRDDLAEVNRQVLAGLTAQRPLDAAVIAASFRSPDAATALRRFWQDRYERAALVVHHAVARGEVPAGTDAQAVLVAATSPLYHQHLLLGRPIEEKEAVSYAHAAADAAAARTFARPPTEGDTDARP